MMRHNENHKERYAQEDVNGKLIFTLLDINHTIRGLYEGRGSQKGVLMMLNETGTITQRELTERLGIQPGSASEVIAKLENAGLVTRTPSETDRRTADVSLTDAGREQAVEYQNQRAQRHVEMFSMLSDDEKSQLLAMLEKLSADWEERYAKRLEHRHGHHHGEGHGPHSEQEGHHHHHGGEIHRHEGHDVEGGHHGCNHDCANCPHPCPKGRARLEGEQ